MQSSLVRYTRGTASAAIPSSRVAAPSLRPGCCNASRSTGRTPLPWDVAQGSGALLTSRRVPCTSFHAAVPVGMGRTKPSHVTYASRIAEYMSPGPNRSHEINGIKAILPRRFLDEPVSVQMMVTVPLGLSNCPLVVISPGFMLDAASYRSYADQLASWGYASVLYDITEILPDTDTVEAIQFVIDYCIKDPEVGPFVDRNTILLCGHSRGGKLSVLTAAKDARIKALALLDPVNNSAMTPSGPDYPSAYPPLCQMTGEPRNLPVLIIGAAANGDVIPAEANYRRFTERCYGPTWEIDLQGVGHLQFLDKQNALFSLFVNVTKIPDADVRAVCRAALLEWFSCVVRPSLPPAALRETLERSTETLRTYIPLIYTLRGLDRIARSSMGGGESSSGDGQYSGGPNGGARQYNASSSAGSSSGGYGSSTAQAPPTQGVTLTRDELMKMRAKELKALLNERGIKSDDCFEKNDLVDRVLAKCA